LCGAFGASEKKVPSNLKGVILCKASLRNMSELDLYEAAL
jgi:hypothetical protein